MLTFHSFTPLGSTYSHLHHRLPKSLNADAIFSLHFFLNQTPSPLGFNDTIYHEGNISKMPDFDVFFLLSIKKKTEETISW